MSPSTLVVIELLLVLGAVLGFGFHQLWSLRRDAVRLDGRAERGDQGPPPAGATGDVERLDGDNARPLPCPDASAPAQERSSSRGEMP